MRRFCLTGIKGIGKTTLIQSILKSIPNIDYLIGSQILRKLVGSEFDNFDYFPEEKKKYYREKAIDYMINRQNDLKKDILVDGHTSLYNPVKKEPNNVFTELDCKFFTDLILFESEASEVLDRRKTDPSKKRITDLNIIEKELRFERENSLRIAKKYGMKIHYINEDNIIDPKSELIKILKRN